MALFFGSVNLPKTEIAAELFFPEIEAVQKVEHRHTNSEVV